MTCVHNAFYGILVEIGRFNGTRKLIQRKRTLNIPTARCLS